MPDNKITQLQVETMFVTPDAYSDDLTDLVSEFIRTAAWLLAYGGCVHYEIIRVQEPSLDAAKPQLGPGLTLGHIPGEVIHKGPNYRQMLHPNEEAIHKHPYISIPGSDVWTIDIPEALGGPRQHKRLLKVLTLPSLPEFALQAIRNQKPSRSFDPKVFNTAQIVALARLTSIWGWGANQIWSELESEYYFVYRRLQFARAMIILRDHIVLSMNHLLERLNFSCQLSIEGLPTLFDVQGWLIALENRELSFKDAIDKAYDS